MSSRLKNTKIVTQKHLTFSFPTFWKLARLRLKSLSLEVWFSKKKGWLVVSQFDVSNQSAIDFRACQKLVGGQASAIGVYLRHLKKKIDNNVQSGKHCFKNKQMVINVADRWRLFTGVKSYRYHWFDISGSNLDPSFLPLHRKKMQCCALNEWQRLFNKRWTNERMDE